MPDQKISVDPAAADLSGCIIPVVTGGINKQAAASLFGITGVANGVIYSAGNRNTSDPTNFNYVPTTQTLTVVGPIRTSPVTNEATVATPANGMIIYSTALSKFRAYENGAWVNLIGGATPAWLLASGGTLTGANTIDQTITAGNIVKFLTPGLGVIPIEGKGLWIQNATAAAAGAQQISGSLTLEGQGWSTGSTSSGPIRYIQYVTPTQQAAAQGKWTLASSQNNGAYLTALVHDLASQTLTIGVNNASLATAGELYFFTAGTQRTVMSIIGNFTFGTTINNAKVYINQAALSSSWIPALRIDPGAHTSMTAATEFKDYNFTTRTATWLAGTTATQRFAHFQGQTVAGASASATFTDLYTVYIDPSIVGTNASVTRNWALGVGGNMRLGSNGNLFIGESSADPLIYSQSSVNPLYLGSTGIGHDTYVRGANFYIITGASAEAMRVTSAANVLIGSTSSNARLYVVQAALTTTGGLPAIRVDGGAHTNLTASVEVLFANFNSIATVQYATGSQAILRNILVQAPTIGFVGASTITDNATFTISGAPKAGTNTTQTNTHGLLIQAGAVTSAGSAFGLTVNAPTGGTLNYAAQTKGGSFLFAAGTTTYAPIIIPTGTNLTTSAAGALENDGTHLWFTFANSGARWQLDNQVGTFGWALAGNTLVADGIIGDIGTGGFKISLYTNNTARQVIDSKGNFTFTQDAQSTSNTFINATQGNHTGGTNRVLLISNGTRTSQTAPVGFNAYFAFGQNTQLATGNVTLLRSIQFESGGISFVGASTVTNAVNIYVYGALSAGANATFTNAHSIYVESTSVGATTTNSYGLTVNAQFGATNNYSAQFLGGNVGIGLSAPLSALDVAGSFGTNTRTITTSATLAATDHTVLCDSTGGVVAVTLPAAAGAKGRIYVVKKIDASANNVTLATVDGGTKTITTRYSGFAVQSDGSLWYVIASF